MTAHHRRAFGDWQTPNALAHAVMATVARQLPTAPSTIVEPTCGVGNLLAAASQRFAAATLVGFDIREDYVAQARSQLPGGARVEVADFFLVPWESVLLEVTEPLLVVGNPPWVTSADLTTLGLGNVPQKLQVKGLSGLDALTGKSNFDLSEWMVLRLAGALVGRRAVLALLCKTAVARRVLEHTAKAKLPLAPLGMWRIDARAHFAVAVDSVLFVLETSTASSSRCPIFATLEATTPESVVDVIDGTLVADAVAYRDTTHLHGVCAPEWRSGLKHDCSRVMELTQLADRLVNGLGHAVDVEGDYLFPFMKSSDVANGRAPSHAAPSLPLRSRRVIVPQQRLGEDTRTLEHLAPRLWSYLTSHAELLQSRRSAIYRSQPPFSIFGIGAYSFAPWKIAISGLYKRLTFSLLEPLDGKSVMVDDTCYFLPFWSEDEARTTLAVLTSEDVQRFYSARVFWDAKRPINKALLQSLDLARLRG